MLVMYSTIEVLDVIIVIVIYTFSYSKKDLRYIYWYVYPYSNKFAFLMNQLFSKQK